MNDLASKLRIIWAIALKDIIDAIQNKSIQGVMLGILMMMATGRALPLLTGLSEDKTLIVYDQGKSRLILGLRKQDNVRLGRAESRAEMEETIGTAANAILGLVLPAGFDEAIAQGRTPALAAYAVHWAKQSEVDELQAFFEGALAELTGRSVVLNVDPQRIYPAADAQGFTSMATGVIVLVTITVGIFLVPYLIGDERQAKTMDALLVSPASMWQIVAGKAVAGSIYCLVTAAIAIASNGYLVVHWGVVVLTVACGTAFAVGLGLLLGSLFELPPHMNAFAGLLLAALLLPIFLADSLRAPPAVRTILSFVPSTALTNALKASLAQTVPLGRLWTDLGAVLGFSAVVYALSVWAIRRRDR